MKVWSLMDGGEVKVDLVYYLPISLRPIVLFCFSIFLTPWSSSNVNTENETKGNHNSKNRYKNDFVLLFSMMVNFANAKE